MKGFQPLAFQFNAFQQGGLQTAPSGMRRLALIQAIEDSLKEKATKVITPEFKPTVKLVERPDGTVSVAPVTAPVKRVKVAKKYAPEVKKEHIISLPTYRPKPVVSYGEIAKGIAAEVLSWPKIPLNIKTPAQEAADEDEEEVELLLLAAA